VLALSKQNDEMIGLWSIIDGYGKRGFWVSCSFLYPTLRVFFQGDAFLARPSFRV
jgi:hypothetical protein